MKNCYYILWEKDCFCNEIDVLYEQLDNYRENMGILIEQIKEETTKANKQMSQLPAK